MAHRSTLKKRQKTFKARHSTKGSIKAANKGRVDQEEGHASKHVMLRHERRNLKNQIRSTKQSQLAERTRIFDGRNGVPRNVAIIPLTPDVDSVQVAQSLSKSLECVEEGMGVASVPKFRQKVRFFVPAFSQFFDMLDCARAADFVLFVLSANKEITDYGEQIMRCITLQGVTTSFGLIWGLSDTNVGTSTKEKGIRDSLTSWFSYFFANERLYSINSDSEVAMIGRLLCQKSPRGLHWRDDRPYIVANKAQVMGANMIVEGYVRGQQLSPDCYMHIHKYGDFRVARIESLSTTDTPDSAWEPSDAKPVSKLLPVSEAIQLEDDSDSDAEEQTGIRIDGHTDVSRLVDSKIADNTPMRAKTVPQGTSDYQAAWFLEGEDYRSDFEDEEGELTDEEGELAPTKKRDATEIMADEGEHEMEDEEEIGDSEELEDMDIEDIGIQSRKRQTSSDAAKEDLQFPDEVELDPHESGKQRFHRYRGARSIRHTHWNAYEKDPRMPEEYTRLYRPGNLVATKNRIGKLLSDGAPVGCNVRVYLEGTNDLGGAGDPMEMLNRGLAFTVYGLLPGEEKEGYVSATMAMDSEVSESIKSKQQVVVQYGPRRLLINPLFSQDGHTDNNVHKFNRFLHPGRSAVATFIAPVFLGNAPVVFYRTQFENEQVVLGSGSIQDSDANRIIVKTAILTGLPVKIHRKLVTVRHMFFSRNDVEWFSGVPLYTKLGAQGFIKECLGTHGLFKATFDKKIRSEDTIALPLYKRVWPKRASPTFI